MSPVLLRIRCIVEALVGGVIAWLGIARGFQTLEPSERAVYFALPGLALALVSFPIGISRWWARLALGFALWGAAFYTAYQLYYPVGSGAGACAIAGLIAGAALLGVALRAAPGAVSTHPAVLLVCGALWVVGASLVGHGVELNLDHPLIQRRPGAPFLVAGALLWHLPFGVLRALRPRTTDTSLPSTRAQGPVETGSPLEPQ